MEDLYKPGDLITTIVNKAVAKQDSGLKVEAINGKCFVRKVTGLVKDRNIPIQMGDQIVELNDHPPEDYGTIERMKKELRDCKRIKVVLVRSTPGSYRAMNKSKEYIGGEGSDTEKDEQFLLEGADDKEPDFPRLTNGGAGSFRNKGYDYHHDEKKQSDPSIVIKAGSVMQLTGLYGRSELNGGLVDVIEEDIKPGRWLVELHGFDESKLSVAEFNLKYPGDDDVKDEPSPEDDGVNVHYGHRRKERGRRGHSEDDAFRAAGPGNATNNNTTSSRSTQSYSQSSNKVRPESGDVSLATSTPSVIPYGKTMEGDSVIVLGTSNSKIKAGDMMKLRRLKAKAKWNGKLVKVEGKDLDSLEEEEERWLVEIMESGEIVSIATKNLVAV